MVGFQPLNQHEQNVKKSFSTRTMVRGSVFLMRSHTVAFGTLIVAPVSLGFPYTTRVIGVLFGQKRMALVDELTTR